MVKIGYARGIGTYDVLLADHVVLTAAALDVLAGEAPSDAAPSDAAPAAADETGGEDA
jgi:hypothetical protein